MIRAVVVDDEPYACQALLTLLKKHCPDIQVVAACNSAQEAEVQIRAQQPQLLFLDIEMPHRNGFELLEQLQPFSFKVIFTTSYDQYAIRAIRFSALDYLLKPIDPRELQAAVEKAKLTDADNLVPAQFQLLLQSFRETPAINERIALPTLEGLHMLNIDSILYCTANSNYTTFTLKEKKKLVVSRTLKEIDEMLSGNQFIRIHHSYLVSIKAIDKYIRGEGGTVIISDGTELDVSRSRKEALINALQAGK
ncbi:MAG: response regulator transcription factor [Pedobacter sp.]|nr:MAG: response regulator transcription factor [Pedobacter sp.]